MKIINRRSVLLGGVLAASLGVSRAQVPDKTDKPSSAAPSPATKHGVTEQLLYTTVMINTTDKKGSTGSGTGSVIQLFTHEGKGVPLIVTNKHVLVEAVSLTLKFSRKNDDGSPDQQKTEVVRLTDIENWIPHPDPTVDLVAYPLWPLTQQLADQGRPIFYISIDNNLIPTDDALNELSPLEDVVIVGYPDGIYDSVHNIPVLRKGITATPMFLDFDGKREFLIDAAIYPGSSGSPVFLYNQGAWLDKANHVQFGIRAQLLGIVWGVRLHTQPGQIAIIPAPTQQAISLTQLPNNLGACIKSTRILEFEPEIVKRGFRMPDGYKMRAIPS